MLSSGGFVDALKCQYSCIFTPPGHWITASIPIGSLKGSTMTYAPVDRAALIACYISMTRYPVRSCQNENGNDVCYAKINWATAGVNMYCISLVLVTGVTFPTIRWD